MGFWTASTLTVMTTSYVLAAVLSAFLAWCGGTRPLLRLVAAVLVGVAAGVTVTAKVGVHVLRDAFPLVGITPNHIAISFERLLVATVLSLHLAFALHLLIRARVWSNRFCARLALSMAATGLATIVTELCGTWKSTLALE